MGRYIEKLGTGIRRMKQAVRACGLREPKLFDTGIDFVVILFGPADKEEHIKKQERLGRIHLTMDSVKTPQAAAHRGEVSERAENGGGLIRAYPDHGSGIRSRRERKDEKRISFKWIISVMLSSAVILSIIVSHGRHNNPAFRYNSASLLHANNEYYGAIEAYRRFLKRFPADKKAVDAQYYMAGCYEMLEDNMKALNAYDELINKYPSSQWAVYARYWRGGIYTRLNRFDDAITEYQKISQGYPDHTLAPEALYGIALAYQKQGEFEKAIDGYEKLLNLKLYSSDGQEYYQMALCYLGLGQPEKAKDALQDVVSGENADPELVKKATEKIKELERAQDTTWNKRPIIKSEK